MFATKGDTGPYYFDCVPIAAGLFERAPGARSLICEAEGQPPVSFDNEEDASDFLRANVTAGERRKYNWTLISAQVLAEEGHTIGG